jgi:hypothetical protein
MKLIRFFKKMLVNLIFFIVFVIMPLLVVGEFIHLLHWPTLHIFNLYVLDGALTLVVIWLIIKQLTRLWKWAKEEWRDA